ncbi:hypothetical protein EBI_26260 [Enterocytozoon bieneusi H348]|nr:hypothetical protein EBI_26260 [Enterocytozoon bieneusi H348]|eukprot:XP_002650893.1 hypothetical protein EBI_26260 [Enterocytozoon bieneusi H348]
MKEFFSFFFLPQKNPPPFFKFFHPKFFLRKGPLFFFLRNLFPCVPPFFVFFFSPPFLENTPVFFLKRAPPGTIFNFF